MPDLPLPLPSSAQGPPPPVPAALKGPPGPTGAATVAQPMQGHAAGAMADVRNALNLLMKALPGLPLGTELQVAVHKAAGDILKHLGPGDREANKAIDGQALMQQLRQMQQAATIPGPLKAANAGGGPAPALPPPPQLAAAA